MLMLGRMYATVVGFMIPGLANFGMQTQVVGTIRMLLEPLQSAHAVSAHMGRKAKTCLY